MNITKFLYRKKSGPNVIYKIQIHNQDHDFLVVHFFFDIKTKRGRERVMDRKENNRRAS